MSAVGDKKQFDGKSKILNRKIARANLERAGQPQFRPPNTILGACQKRRVKVGQSMLRSGRAAGADAGVRCGWYKRAQPGPARTLTLMVHLLVYLGLCAPVYLESSGACSGSHSAEFRAGADPALP